MSAFKEILPFEEEKPKVVEVPPTPKQFTLCVPKTLPMIQLIKPLKSQSILKCVNNPAVPGKFLLIFKTEEDYLSHKDSFGVLAPEEKE